MDQKPNTKELEHYGVLGMKWGVRRSQAQLDRAASRRKSKKKANLRSSSRPSKKKDSPGTTPTRTNNSSKARLGSRSLSDIGDKELREITNRMEMETKYNKLTGSGKSRGRQIVENTLSGMKQFNDVVNTSTNTYNNGKKIIQGANNIRKAMRK